MSYDYPHCRLCHGAVPEQLGWLYYAELSGPEIRQLCRGHLEAIVAQHEHTP